MIERHDLVTICNITQQRLNFSFFVPLISCALSTYIQFISQSSQSNQTLDYTTLYYTTH